ncbi:hypothetical protein D3C78_1141380 [compost metagenome]
MQARHRRDQGQHLAGDQVAICSDGSSLDLYDHRSAAGAGAGCHGILATILALQHGTDRGWYCAIQSGWSCRIGRLLADDTLILSHFDNGLVIRFGGGDDLANDPGLVVIGITNAGADGDIERLLDAELGQHCAEAGFEIQLTTGDNLAQSWDVIWHWLAPPNAV